MREIYLDNSAATPIEKEVLSEMNKSYLNDYGNPSSMHSRGLQAHEQIENARKMVAKEINCKSSEIIFTSGGTESNNLAIKGAAYANKDKGDHIITSTIEHKGMLNICKSLEKEGFQITYVDVDKKGIINPEDVRKSITKKTILISIMHANNEIGTIQPIKEIGKIAKENKILFHTDACQSIEYIPIDVSALKVDMLSLNGAKIYGPRGIGVLFLKEGTKLKPIIDGGGQEKNIRSGSENVPAIVGFAKAMQILEKNRLSEALRVTKLRDKLITNLLKIPKTKLNGDSEKRLPNNVNISFFDIEGESILLHLNEKGIYASSGSACTSSNLETSHVIKALGMSYEASHGSIRFSLGRHTTEKDIDYVIKVMPGIVNKLRSISPLSLSTEHFK